MVKHEHIGFEIQHEFRAQATHKFSEQGQDLTLSAWGSHLFLEAVLEYIRQKHLGVEH